MNTRALAAAVAAAVWAFVPLSAHAATVNVVEVRSNEFLPRSIQIARGETVTWVARDGGHTVTADDDRFSFPASGTLAQGQSVSWTFGGDETVAYRCRVHGPGMAGVVVVGAGSPPPPPPADPPVRVVPSEAFPTVARALAGAEPGTVVEVLPGTYRYPITVTVPSATIRGTGASPGEVVIDGDDARAVGIRVLADGVRIENLTVRGHGIAGISAEGVSGIAIECVDAVSTGSDGIRLVEVTRASLRSVTVDGNARAGIEIAGGESVFVQGARASANGTGVLVTDAASTIVTDSALWGNRSGIVLRAHRGAHLWGNTITGDGAAGVWLDGGRAAIVERNRVDGHMFGVVVTALAGPSLGERIEGNVIEGASRAALAWDGIGVGVCLARNARGDGSEPATEPAFAGTVYSCDLPHTVGVPWPAVTAAMAGA